MEMLVYARVIWKRAWVVLFVCLIAGVGAMFYSLSQTPVYQTSTLLMLNPATPSALLPYRLSAQTMDALAATYGQFLKTRAFAQLVSDATGSQVSAGEVMSGLSTQIVGGTQFMRVTAKARTPEMAQMLANTAARVFIQENLSRQRARQDVAAAQLSGQSQESLVNRASIFKQKLEDELKYYQDNSVVLRKRLEDLEVQQAAASGREAEEGQKNIMSMRQQLLEVNNLTVRAMTALLEYQSKESSLLSSAVIDTAEVIDEAPLPGLPSEPKTRQNVLFALALALIAGLGGVFLLEYIDYTFKSADELDEAYGGTTLGVLGRIGRDVRVGGPLEKVVSSQPRSAISEAFRILRTNVQFASLGKPVRSLLFTSCAPSEGKTFTTTNFAISLAQAGKRVILVDADMRRPRLHIVFGLGNEVGLSSLALENGAKIEQLLQPTEVEGLRVLTSGPIPPNPAEILGMPSMDGFIHELQAHADIVIFDTPPTTVVADAAVLAAKVDAAIQVVCAGTTRRDLVMKGRTSLDKVGARVLGPVLNMARVGDADYYHGYHYYSSSTAPAEKSLGTARGEV